MHRFPFDNTLSRNSARVENVIINIERKAIKLNIYPAKKKKSYASCHQEKSKVLSIYVKVACFMYSFTYKKNLLHISDIIHFSTACVDVIIVIVVLVVASLP